MKDEQDGKAKEEFVESQILTIVVSIVKSTCETGVFVSLYFFHWFLLYLKANVKKQGISFVCSVAKKSNKVFRYISIEFNFRNTRSISNRQSFVRVILL